MGHCGIPALFQDNLVTGQHLLNFRRSHFGAICALVSLRGQGVLPLPHHFPLPLFPRDTRAVSRFHTRIPDFREVPKLTHFWLLFRTGDVSGGRGGSFPDYTQQPFLAFEVKSTRGHPSNTNSATALPGH